MILKSIAKFISVIILLIVLFGGALAVRYWLWNPDPMHALYARAADHVLVVGHRGAPTVAPENTIASFLAAFEAEADAVELDVHLTSDNELVVIHDDTADRTTDGTGRIEDMSLEEVKALDAGSWFSGRFAGTKVPTLAEVFDALPADAPVLIEIKSQTIQTNGVEKTLAAFVAERDLYDRIAVISFNPISLARVKMADKRIPTGLLYGPGLPSFLSQGWAIPVVLPDAVHPELSMVDEAYLQRAHGRGHRVNVWTVDDEDEMWRLVGLGVDGVTTNRPDVLREVLDEAAGTGG
jgi:glycerophosphoryl diester phosphodiesterase